MVSFQNFQNFKEFWNIMDEPVGYNRNYYCSFANFSSSNFQEVVHDKKHLLSNSKYNFKYFN